MNTNENSLTEDCPICLNTLNENDYTKIECGHKFHFSCLHEWILQENTCPFCRKSIKLYDKNVKR